MKKSYFFALATLVLASCANDSFNGVEAPATGEPGAIAFGSGTGKVSRAQKEGTDAATLLGNEFVVEGFKTMADNSTQLVFNDYTVKYTDGSALSTASNTKGWEYVNETNGQTIKYWDNNADKYTFVAYSTKPATGAVDVKEGDGTGANTGALYSNIGTTNPVYTMSGTVADLLECYVSNVEVVENANFAQHVSPDAAAQPEAVTLTFKKNASKVRIGLYEVVSGYAVKDVKFYVGGAESKDDYDAPVPTLAAADDEFLPTTANASLTVKYPMTTVGTETIMVPTIEYAATTATDLVNHVDFPAISLHNGEAALSAAQLYLGTASNASSITDYVSVLPLVAGDLTLKVDYTLVSVDGSGEEIKVEGKTAVVPAAYTNWQANYAYTYLFKISEASSDLYPITFDAVVVETEDTYQETITTITNPSITTYQNGKKVTENNEYVAGDIYASVFTTAVETLSAANSALYVVDTANSTIVANETNIGAAIAAGKTDNETDYFDKTALKLTMLYPAYVTSVPGEEGQEINISAMKFTAAAGNTYVVHYHNGTDNVYKVIKVQ